MEALETEYSELFRSMITEPLTRLVGRSLRSVIYYVLYFELPDFDVDAANASVGCQGVRLIFDGGEVELDWDWQSALRGIDKNDTSSVIAYHIVARSISERQALVQVYAEDDEDVSGLGSIEATTAVPWKSVHGEVLRSVTVWGFLLPNSLYSPQAVTFSFDSGMVAITIGYIQMQPLWIGDGDEVLVFTEQEWNLRVTQQPENELVPLWQYPIATEHTHLSQSEALE